MNRNLASLWKPVCKHALKIRKPYKILKITPDKILGNNYGHGGPGFITKGFFRLRTFASTNVTSFYVFEYQVTTRYKVRLVWRPRTVTPYYFKLRHGTRDASVTCQSQDCVCV